MFTNNNSLTTEKVQGPYLSSVYCDYPRIWEILEEKGNNYLFIYLFNYQYSHNGINIY